MREQRIRVFYIPCKNYLQFGRPKKKPKQKERQEKKKEKKNQNHIPTHPTPAYLLFISSSSSYRARLFL